MLDMTDHENKPLLHPSTQTHQSQNNQRNKSIINSSKIQTLLSEHPLINPILAGILSSLVTLTGQYFFKIPEYNLISIVNLVLGVVLFVFLNKYFLKFQFNSYQLVGVTLSTVIIFCVQNIVIGMNRIHKLSIRWWIGMALACLGVILISNDAKSQNNQLYNDKQTSINKININDQKRSSLNIKNNKTE